MAGIQQRQRKERRAGQMDGKGTGGDQFCQSQADSGLESTQTPGV